MLLTGFGPFMTVETNPSWLAVKPLHNTLLDLSSSSSPASSSGLKARVQCLQVPVHYGSILDLVPRIHGNKPTSEAHFWHDERLDPGWAGTPGSSYPSGCQVDPKPWDVIIHVGVARPGKLRLETLAHKTGYNKRDANGSLAPIVTKLTTPTNLVRGFGEGYEACEEEERSKVDVAKLVSWLKGEGLGMGEEEVEKSLDPGRYLCDFIYYASLAESKKAGKGTWVLFVHVPPAGEPLTVERCREAIKGVALYMASKKAALTT